MVFLTGAGLVYFVAVIVSISLVAGLSLIVLPGHRSNGSLAAIGVLLVLCALSVLYFGARNEP